MSTILAPITTPAPVKVSLVARLRGKIASVLAFLAVLVVVAPTSANAAPAPAPGANLLGGSETSFFSTIQGYLTGSLLPLVFVLAAVVIGAGMLIKYGRKAVSS